MGKNKKIEFNYDLLILGFVAVIGIFAILFMVQSQGTINTDGESNLVGVAIENTVLDDKKSVLVSNPVGLTIETSVGPIKIIGSECSVEKNHVSDLTSLVDMIENGEYKIVSDYDSYYDSEVIKFKEENNQPTDVVVIEVTENCRWDGEKMVCGRIGRCCLKTVVVSNDR